MSKQGEYFWSQFDKISKKQFCTLKEFCEVAGFGYNNILTQRTRTTMPKAEQVFLTAQILETSVINFIAIEKGQNPEWRELDEILSLARLLTQCSKEQLDTLKSMMATWGVKK